MTQTLTTATHELFMNFANEAHNWFGAPPVDYVGMTKEQCGNLTDLKIKGLITTTHEDGETWIRFTAAGAVYAAENGVKELDLYL